jgi:hypothetical protein
MNEPTPRKITRIDDLPRDIPPPRDGWPALEARLRESGVPQPDDGARQGSEGEPPRRRRPRIMQIAALAAVLAAVAVGISIDRWILSPAPVAAPTAATRPGSAPRQVSVAYLTDPRYLRERAALLHSLNARLAGLPPPTRKKVLDSLATIQQSMREIQQALGREPGNALLQELLIDTCQDEMQLLSTVQEASGGSGET